MSLKENVVTNYIKQSIEELGKVTWPTRNQAIRLTIIVLIFCVVVALLLGAIDYGFSYLYNLILKTAL